MPQRRQQGKPARTVLEQKIWDRGETLAEFVEYAERFARQVGERGTLSERNLKRLVAGRNPDGSALGSPRPATARLLERIFGLHIDVLLSPPTSDTGSRYQESQEEIQQRLRVSRRVDAPLLALLREQLQALRRLDRQLGATVARDEVIVKCRQVSSLLAYCTTTGNRERLAAILSELETLAGWQALDAGDISDAWHHYNEAKDAARESGLTAFEAHAAAEQTFVLLDIGNFSDAVNLISEIEKNSHKTVNRLLRSWLLAARGEALAAVQNESESLRAFDQALSSLPSEAPSEEDPYVALDQIHLMRWRGHALSRLIRPDAVDVLSAALERLDRTFTRAEASLRTDLTFALLNQGDRVEARTQANLARSLAFDVGSTRQLRRLRLISNGYVRPLHQQ